VRPGVLLIGRNIGNRTDGGRRAQTRRRNRPSSRHVHILVRADASVERGSIRLNLGRPPRSLLSGTPFEPESPDDLSRLLPRGRFRPERFDLLSVIGHFRGHTTLTQASATQNQPRTINLRGTLNGESLQSLAKATATGVRARWAIQSASISEASLTGTLAGETA